MWSVWPGSPGPCFLLATYLHAALVSFLAKEVSSRTNNCVASGYEEEAAHLISEASLWEYQYEFHFQSNKTSFVAYPLFPTRASQSRQCPHCGYFVYHTTLHIHKAACQGGQWWRVQPPRVMKFFGVDFFKHTPEVSTMSATEILLIYVQNDKKN